MQYSCFRINRRGLLLAVLPNLGKAMAHAFLENLSQQPWLVTAWVASIITANGIKFRALT